MIEPPDCLAVIWVNWRLDHVDLRISRDICEGFHFEAAAVIRSSLSGIGDELTGAGQCGEVKISTYSHLLD
jgi:hypothetical protein